MLFDTTVHFKPASEQCMNSLVGVPWRPATTAKALKISQHKSSVTVHTTIRKEAYVSLTPSSEVGLITLCFLLSLVLGKNRMGMCVTGVKGVNCVQTIFSHQWYVFVVTKLSHTRNTAIAAPSTIHIHHSITALPLPPAAP